jgi:hypothetical protein
LNALGIVVKDQQLVDAYLIGGKPDFLWAYGYVYLLLVFDYEPLGMSLCRLRGRLFMQRVNMKKTLRHFDLGWIDLLHSAFDKSLTL